MIGEIVTHSRYGRGTVAGFEPPRIDIRFGDGQAPRRFAWPAAARFLTFEDPAAAEAARLAEQSAEASRQEKLALEADAHRRREEQLAALHQELQRQKRAAAAKKTAANRAIRAAKAARDGK